MMKGWAKFKPPPNFVQKEEQLKTMDPGEKLSMDYILGQLNILIDKSSGGTKSQYEAILADLIVDQKKNAYAEEFIEEFIMWILGRSCKNVRYEHDEFNPNGQRVIDLDPPMEVTPWGNTPYTHLEDVKDFLDQIVDNRMAAIKYISKLKLRYPRNLADLWFWWKYIVHKQGVDGAIINYARWLEPYDFIPPEKVPVNPLENPPDNTYSYFEPNEDGKYFQPSVYISPSAYVNDFILDNPNPPPYDPARAKAIMDEIEEAMVELAEDPNIVANSEQYQEQILKIYNEFIVKNAYAFCEMDMQRIKTRMQAKVSKMTLEPEEKTHLMEELGLDQTPDQAMYGRIDSLLKHHLGGVLSQIQRQMPVYNPPAQMNYVFAAPPPNAPYVAIPQSDSTPDYLQKIYKELQDKNSDFSLISKSIDGLNSTTASLAYSLSTFQSSKANSQFESDVKSLISSLMERSERTDAYLSSLESKIKSPSVFVNIPKDFNKGIVSSLSDLSRDIKSLIVSKKEEEGVEMIQESGPPPPGGGGGGEGIKIEKAMKNLHDYLAGTLQRSDKLSVIQSNALKKLSKSMDSMDFPGMSARLEKTISNLVAENTKAYGMFTEALEKGFGKEASSMVTEDMNSSELQAQVDLLNSQRAVDIAEMQTLTNKYNKASIESQEIRDAMDKLEANYEKIKRDQKALRNLSVSQKSQIAALNDQNVALEQMRKGTEASLKQQYDILLAQNTKLLLDIKNQNLVSAEQERLIKEAREAKDSAVKAEELKYNTQVKKHQEELDSLRSSLSFSQQEIMKLNNLVSSTHSSNNAALLQISTEYNRIIHSLKNENMFLYQAGSSLKSDAQARVRELEAERDLKIQQLTESANSNMNNLLSSVQGQIQSHMAEVDLNTQRMQAVMAQKDAQIEEYKNQQANFKALAERVRQLENSDPSTFPDVVDTAEQEYFSEREIAESITLDVAVLQGQVEEPHPQFRIPRAGEGSMEALAYLAAELEVDPSLLEESESALTIEEIEDEQVSPVVQEAVAQLSELEKLTQKNNLIASWGNQNPELQASLRQKYGVAESRAMVTFQQSVNSWAAQTGNENLSEEKKIEKFGEKLERELPANASKSHINKLMARITKMKRQASINSRVNKVRRFIADQSEVEMGGEGAPAPNYTNIGKSLSDITAALAPTEKAAQELGFPNQQQFLNHYLTAWQGVNNLPGTNEQKTRMFLQNAATTTYQNLLAKKSTAVVKNLLESFNGDSLKAIQHLSTFVGSKFAVQGNPLDDIQNLISQTDTGENARQLVMGSGAQIPDGAEMANQTYGVFKAILELENLTVPLRDLASMNAKHFDDQQTKGYIQQLINQVEGMQQQFIQGLSGDIRDLVRTMSNAGIIPVRDVLKSIGSTLRNSAVRAGYNEEELESVELDNLADSGNLDMETIAKNQAVLGKVLSFADKHYAKIKKDLASNVINRSRASYAKTVSEGRTPEYHYSGTEVTGILNDFLGRNGPESLKLLSQNQITLPGPRSGTKQTVGLSDIEARSLETKLAEYRSGEISDEEISSYVQRYLGRHSGRSPMTPQEMANFHLPPGTPHIPVTDRTNVKRRNVAQEAVNAREAKKLKEQERIAAHGQRLRAEAEEKRRNAPPERQQQLNRTPGGAIGMSEIQKRSTENENHAYNSVLAKMGLSEVKSVPIPVLEKLLDTPDGNALLERKGVSAHQIRLAREAFRRKHPKASEGENIVVSGGGASGQRQRQRA